MKLRLPLLLLLILCLAQVAWGIDRRREQFSQDSSYLLLPVPYALPGIGEGWIGLAQAGNLWGTNMDFYALAVTGAGSGRVMALEDIHLISETLIINTFYYDLNRVVFQYFNERGMTSDKEDYTLTELNRFQGNSVQVTLSLFDRRLEAFWSQDKGQTAAVAVRDSEGELISSFDEPLKTETKTTIRGVNIDYTDDHQDPRKGVRLSLKRFDSPRQDVKEAETYQINKQLTAYLPLGDASTWAFAAFTSDAVVLAEGQTDETAIKAELGFDCQGDAVCEQTEADLVTRTQAARKYGNATSLGGDVLLRAYPLERFRGAHSIYFGTELRLTLSDQVTPFDFWIWKDISTGIQFALFSERGASGDDKSKLAEEMRSSNGVGLRMVTASGYIYRADVAAGDEGTAVSMVFGYPW